MIKEEHVILNCDLEQKMAALFPNVMVSKDTVRQMKTTANLPVFLIEFLIGKYCDPSGKNASGTELVKQLISNHFIASDERQKVLSILRRKGEQIIIDHISVRLDLRKNAYFASFSSLGLENIPVADKYAETYNRLLSGGLWCIVKLCYKPSLNKKELPILITSLAPIQVPDVQLDAFLQARCHFSKEEWIDMLIRSIGMEPQTLTLRQKWLTLLRMVPLCESNYNLCELGPRATGKSHVYKEISPYSILVSGGQTTVANLFYNMNTKEAGLVSLWDCVAFDEVAGIQINDKSGVQIMKDYMASGSFVRGTEKAVGHASMVFVGNIDGGPDEDALIFSPFPSAMACDTAFLDRMHAYLPGWEMPKLYPYHFTEKAGLMIDYFSEILRQMRKLNYGDTAEGFFRLSKNANQRDCEAIRKTVSGLTKLVYPDGRVKMDEAREILQLAIEMRQRVKYQLYKLAGDEFKEYDLSYTE